MDEFEAIIADVGEIPDPVPQQDYTTLSDIDLVRAFYLVKRDLLERRVLLHPSQEDDIDKRAQYDGMLQEMAKRGLH